MVEAIDIDLDALPSIVEDMVEVRVIVPAAGVGISLAYPLADL